MGLVIAAIDELRRKLSATVLLVHHTGKPGKSERGSSSLRGAADLMIECNGEPEAGYIHLQCSKSHKESEPFAAIRLAVERVATEWGQSLAIVGITDAPISGGKRDRDQGALDALEGFGSQGATYTEWLNAFSEVTALKKPTFDRALKDLNTSGAIRHENGRYYLQPQGGGA